MPCYDGNILLRKKKRKKKIKKVGARKANDENWVAGGGPWGFRHLFYLC